MRVVSICSGIGTDAIAWQPLGWGHLCFSEIEKFPSAILRHRWSGVPNEGDFTKIGDKYRGAADLLVGGTPCQSFSVAGKRAGLDDPRGNLTLEFARLAARIRPRWLVWENVPGVLSIDEGRTFGTFLGILGKLGYGFAYRVLDAQHFGVPQRRRRVFVVGCLGDWRRAAAVLFERHSLQGHNPPSRKKGQGTPNDIARSVAIRGREGTPQAELGDDKANAILTPNGGRGGIGVGAVLAPSVYKRRGGFGWSEANGVSPTLESESGSHQGGPEHVPIIPILEAGARTGKSTDDPRAGMGVGEPGDPMFTLQSGKQHAIAFSNRGIDGELAETVRSGCHGALPMVAHAIRTAQTSANGHGVAEDVAHTLDGAQVPAVAFEPRYYAEDRLRPGGAPSETVATLKHSPKQGDTAAHVATGMAVRRLTPRECERLQGLPDDYTLIPYNGKLAADGPRYKAIGNGMAVPVIRWIGERIKAVEHLT